MKWLTYSGRFFFFYSGRLTQGKPVARTTSTKSYAISFLRFTSFSRTCSTSASSTAWVLMAHKSSKRRSDPCSYRPISLLYCLSKVFEAIMTKRLMGWAENTDKLPTKQSGFKKHHSTNDKLFELTQSVCQAHRLSRRVGAIFLDIEKEESGTMAYVTNCYTRMHPLCCSDGFPAF